MFLPTLLQRHIKKIIASTALVAVLFPFGASAQTLHGLEISPFLMELDVAKGGTLNSHIDLFNHGTEPLVIDVAPRDFLPGEDGQPQFVPDPQINDPTFSLSAWVKVQTPDHFVLKPGEAATVNFNINPPLNAEQGTHYGAILFSYQGQSSVGNVSEVQQSVGTILLVYYGQGRENGTDQLSSDKQLYWQADKVSLTNKFDNTGNVHVKPKGEVYIRNMLGHLVATTFINRDAANVLPKTNRTFLGAWYPSSLSFGRYTAETVITYGRGRLEAKDKIVIWILPWYLDIGFGLLVALILWIIFHGRHLHKRRVIRKHLEKTQLQ